MNKGKILLIKPDAIGDFVLFSACLPYFRERFQAAEISLLVQNHIVEFAESLSGIDKIIGLDKEDFFNNREYTVLFMNRLKQYNFDKVIYAAYSRDVLGDFIALNCNAAETITFEGDTSNTCSEILKENRKKYSKVIEITLSSNSELERLRKFTENVCGKEIFQSDFQPQLGVPEENGIYVKKTLEENGIVSSFSVIAPFPGHYLRKWQTERWAVVLNNFHEHTFVICGTENDVTEADKIIELSDNKNVFNFCGRLSLIETVALIKECEFLTGVESAPCHIATAIGVPSVVLTGGGHFGRFVPYSNLQTLVNKEMDCYGCNWQCKYERVYCMEEIRVEEVVSAVENVSGFKANVTRRKKETSGQYYSYASWSKSLDDIESAKQFFEGVIALNEDQVMVGGAYYHLADLFFKQGETGKAVSYAKKCLAIIPEHSEAKKIEILDEN